MIPLRPIEYVGARSAKARYWGPVLLLFACSFLFCFFCLSAPESRNRSQMRVLPINVDPNHLAHCVAVMCNAYVIKGRMSGAPPTGSPPLRKIMITKVDKNGENVEDRGNRRQQEKYNNNKERQ